MSTTDASPSNPPESAIARTIRALGSSWLAVTVLLLLLIVTFLGTLAQTEHGLHAVQETYFESVFLVHDLWGKVPVPLPGGYLLMGLLSLNLLIGGLVRARKGWRFAGILVCHAGILSLMLSALVTYHWSTEGSLVLYEGETGNAFHSSSDWAVEVVNTAAKHNNQFVISGVDLTRLQGDNRHTFDHRALPDGFTISGFCENSMPVRAAEVATERVVDGFFLRQMATDPQVERNDAGCYVSIGDDAGGILWNRSTAPWTVVVDGVTWTVRLRRMSWPLPFTIELEDFTHESYPGTTIPKAFRSDVTLIDNGSREAVSISMNRPLRHRGYTLFQSSWGPPDANPGDPTYSIFSVVRNPADQWPLYACIIIGLGMTIHFMQRFLQTLRPQSKEETT
jgi:hypothetical protein